MFTKIKQEDLKGKGVVGQPAVPGLSVLEMQEAVEQVVREVAIPAVNRLVEELAAASAAQSIGAQMPGDSDSAAVTVQTALEKLAQTEGAHARDTENPHAVTAGQTGAYSKQETEERIDAKVVEIGAGDMAQTIYDPQKKKMDVFAAIPNQNLLDNSGFEIWQRGTSFGATEANKYTADRWTNGSGCTLFQKTENGAKQTGAAAAGALLLQQTIEHANGVFDFTLSARIKSDGPFCLSMGSAETVLSETFSACDDFTEVTVSARDFEVSGGKMIVRVKSCLTAANSLTVECQWMKLEHGLVATPWQPKGIGAELAACLRYFERIGSATSSVLGGLNKVDGAQSVPVNLHYYPKRAAPSIVFSAPEQYRVLGLDAAGEVVTALPITSIDLVQPAEKTLACAFAQAPGLVETIVYALLQWRENANSAWIDVSADL